MDGRFVGKAVSALPLIDVPFELANTDCTPFRHASFTHTTVYAYTGNCA